MNPLVKKFGKEKRWLTWKLQIRNGKQTKIPYSISGDMAKSSDPETWCTYNEIKDKNKGIVLFDKKLICIDIDHCLDGKKLIGEDRQTIFEFIADFDSYIEISPSGTGLHCFFEVEEPIDLIANRKGNFEIYNSGRYMTYTGVPYGEAKEIKVLKTEEANIEMGKLGYPWGKEVVRTEKYISTGNELDDNELLEKMFESKNGSDIKELYNGNISKYNNDKSSADMALCSHLAFWTGKNYTQIEKLWGLSPLGKRMKTVSRKDYRERTINNAIKNCNEVYSNPNKEKIERIDQLDFLFTVGAKGQVNIVVCVENIVRALHGHPEFKNTIRYDNFKNVLYIGDKQMEDHDVLTVQTRIQVLFPDFVKVSKDMVYDAMIKVARDNSFDSAKDYITSLKWDGKERVDHWLTMTYHTPDNIYNQSVGSNWLKGLVKRIIVPGCKFDHVLVLEGKQGIKKSTSLMVLGGDWHVETTMSTDNKDFFMMFQGKAIIEFSEGETLNRTEVKRMKAIITTQSDKYRPAYGRLSMDYPRRCVFAMTTNADEYLKDETGNRRWLPVKCIGMANIEWLKENRDQLFAEAYQRVIINNETTWEFPEEEMQKEQDLRRIHDPWEDIIIEWYYELSDSDKQNGISIQDVYEQAVHRGSSNIKPMARYEEMNIADVLRRVLKLEKRRSMLSGQRTNRYFLIGSPEITMEVEKDFVLKKSKNSLDKFVTDIKNSELEDF